MPAAPLSASLIARAATVAKAEGVQITMECGKTQGHIITGHYGPLARWPYGSRHITIILPTPKDAMP